MSCSIDALSEAGLESRIWMEQFQARTRKQRIPLAGMLELTSRCNLRCVHCYLGDQDEQHAKRAQEMDTDRVKALLDEMADAGTLYLTITGGDPMMRKDFPEIYRYAIERGFLVTVFCDGVLVTEKIKALFDEYRPWGIEVSLYGATRETYEKVTRVKGSFEKCLRGIERLLAIGLTLRLKTVLMTVNEHELPAMREMADRFGVSFRFDSAIFPCLPDSSKEPLELRVEPEVAVKHEMFSKARREQWVDYHHKKKSARHSDKLFRCGAGLTSYYVDPFGALSPCLMTTQHRWEVEPGEFEKAWREDLVEIRNRKPQRSDYGCNSCEKQSLCTGCPAFNFLETGEEDKKSEYVCATTQERWKALFGDKSAAEVDAEYLERSSKNSTVGTHPALPILK